MTNRNEEFHGAASAGASKFYHGSKVKLQPGQYVTSPAERGRGNPRRKIADYSPDKVYVTPNYDIAFNYTLANAKDTPGNGYVYQVEPVGKLNKDPDLAKSGVQAHAVDAARVVRVVKEGDPVVGSFGEAKAYRSLADEPSESRQLYPNSSNAKCASCGDTVKAGAGVYIKTGRKAAGTKKYEIYHPEHLES